MMGMERTVGLVTSGELEKKKGSRRVYVDSLVATGMTDDGVFARIAQALDSGDDVRGLLTVDNPLVRHTRERMEVETAQFARASQILAEAVTNGAEARKSGGKEVTVEVKVGEKTIVVDDNGKGMSMPDFLRHFFILTVSPFSIRLIKS